MQEINLRFFFSNFDLLPLFPIHLYNTNQWALRIDECIIARRYTLYIAYF